MTEGRITKQDLDWWLDVRRHPRVDVRQDLRRDGAAPLRGRGRTPGVTHEDMVRAARVIHTFGQPGKYYSLTKIYLVSPDGKYRWWTEDNHFTDTTLVNRATTELFYGIQNAPSTVSGIESPYDEIATTWDVEHPIASGEADHVKRLLSEARGKYPPHVLDIGCGTGRVLDLGLAVAGPLRRRGLQPGNAQPPDPKAPEGRCRLPGRRPRGARGRHVSPRASSTGSSSTLRSS